MIFVYFFYIEKWQDSYRVGPMLLSNETFLVDHTQEFENKLDCFTVIFLSILQYTP